MQKLWECADTFASSYMVVTHPIVSGLTKFYSVGTYCSATVLNDTGTAEYEFISPWKNIYTLRYSTEAEKGQSENIF